MLKLLKKLKNNNCGFSYIESIVVLVLMSVFLTVLSISTFVCMKSIRKVYVRNRETTILLENQKKMRMYINSVKNPFWEKEYVPDFSENKIFLPYNTVEDREALELNENFLINEVEILRNSMMLPIGISVSYSYNGNSYKMVQNFASLYQEVDRLE